MSDPQKTPQSLLNAGLVASGRAIYQKSSCVFDLMVLLFVNRLDLIDPVESKRELQFQPAVQGSIVPNSSNCFQLIFSRCTVGLNRASNAIAIFPLIHGLLLPGLRPAIKRMTWQTITLKVGRQVRRHLNKTFRIQAAVSDKYLCIGQVQV